MEKKKELQKLHDEEMESIKVKKPATVDKMTRTQIAERLEKDRTAAAGNVHFIGLDIHMQIKLYKRYI